jgi:hypothetical protein
MNKVLSVSLKKNQCKATKNKNLNFYGKLVSSHWELKIGFLSTLNEKFIAHIWRIWWNDDDLVFSEI